MGDPIGRGSYRDTDPIADTIWTGTPSTLRPYRDRDPIGRGSYGDTDPIGRGPYTDRDPIETEAL